MEQLNVAPAIEFKSKSVNMASLHIYSANQLKFRSSLKHQIQLSPNLFKNAPVVLDFSKLETDDVPASDFKNICLEYNIFPVAIQNCSDSISSSFLKVGIPKISGSAKPSTPQIGEKIITGSVRSGQQLYFQCPITIIGDVKAGAEIISDHSIHIYGTLHGKAIAGIQSNHDAQIFMESCKAELVSIGKKYLVAQDHNQLTYNHRIRVKSYNGELKVMRL